MGKVALGIAVRLNDEEGPLMDAIQCSNCASPVSEQMQFCANCGQLLHNNTNNTMMMSSFPHPSVTPPNDANTIKYKEHDEDEERNGIVPGGLFLPGTATPVQGSFPPGGAPYVQGSFPPGGAPYVQGSFPVAGGPSVDAPYAQSPFSSGAPSVDAPYVQGTFPPSGAPYAQGSFPPGSTPYVQGSFPPSGTPYMPGANPSMPPFGGPPPVLQAPGQSPGGITPPSSDATPPIQKPGLPTGCLPATLAIVVVLLIALSAYFLHPPASSSAPPASALQIVDETGAYPGGTIIVAGKHFVPGGAVTFTVNGAVAASDSYLAHGGQSPREIGRASG